MIRAVRAIILLAATLSLGACSSYHDWRNGDYAEVVAAVPLAYLTLGISELHAQQQRAHREKMDCLLRARPEHMRNCTD